MFAIFGIFTVVDVTVRGTDIFGTEHLFGLGLKKLKFNSSEKFFHCYNHFEGWTYPDRFRFSAFPQVQEGFVI